MRWKEKHLDTKNSWKLLSDNASISMVVVCSFFCGRGLVLVLGGVGGYKALVHFLSSPLLGLFKKIFTCAEEKYCIFGVSGTGAATFFGESQQHGLSQLGSMEKWEMYLMMLHLAQGIMYLKINYYNLSTAFEWFKRQITGRGDLQTARVKQVMPSSDMAWLRVKNDGSKWLNSLKTTNTVRTHYFSIMHQNPDYGSSERVS